MALSSFRFWPAPPLLPLISGKETHIWQKSNKIPEKTTKLLKNELIYRSRNEYPANEDKH